MGMEWIERLSKQMKSDIKGLDGGELSRRMQDVLMEVSKEFEATDGIDFFAGLFGEENLKGLTFETTLHLESGSGFDVTLYITLCESGDVISSCYESERSTVETKLFECGLRLFGKRLVSTINEMDFGSRDVTSLSHDVKNILEKAALAARLNDSEKEALLWHMKDLNVECESKTNKLKKLMNERLKEQDCPDFMRGREVVEVKLSRGKDMVTDIVWDDGCILSVQWSLHESDVDSVNKFFEDISRAQKVERELSPLINERFTWLKERGAFPDTVRKWTTKIKWSETPSEMERGVMIPILNVDMSTDISDFPWNMSFVLKEGAPEKVWDELIRDVFGALLDLDKNPDPIESFTALMEKIDFESSAESSGMKRKMRI